jgi:hypothetical protein
MAISPLSSTTKLVLHTLGLHMNEAGENSYPSINTIARECSLSRTAVLRHLKVASDAGWVKITKRKAKNGGAASNLYRAAMPSEVEPEDSIQPDKETHNIIRRRADSARCDECKEGRKPEVPRVDAEVDSIIPIEFSKEPTPHVPKADDFELSFERFWAVYPRKASKRGAKRSFDRLIKKQDTTVDAIIAGAIRYAQECTRLRTPHRFIKHPTTWLNNGCWEDEPTPNHAQTVQRHSLVDACDRFDQKLRGQSNGR